MVSKDFLLAGHAIFTVANPKGEYHTYRVSAPDDQDDTKPIWFVSKLTGSDNTSDYTYLGILTGEGRVIHTRKSGFAADSQAFKVAVWAVKLILNSSPLPEGYTIQHVGKCGRCGRPLTTPESLSSGIGPICQNR